VPKRAWFGFTLAAACGVLLVVSIVAGFSWLLAVALVCFIVVNVGVGVQELRRA
jgi:hypothetical protein